MNGANLLILDEPTNHLDIWACDSLEEALKAYEGTVIVVSHDRYFLNRVVDLLDGAGRPRTARKSSTATTTPTNCLRQARENAAGRAAGVSRLVRASRFERARQPSGVKPAKRKRKFPYRKVPDLEADIAATEKKVTELEAAMQTPDVYKDATRVRDTMNELEKTKNALALLYQHWEEAVELNG